MMSWATSFLNASGTNTPPGSTTTLSHITEKSTRSARTLPPWFYVRLPACWQIQTASQKETAPWRDRQGAINRTELGRSSGALSLSARVCLLDFGSYRGEARSDAPDRRH